MSVQQKSPLSALMLGVLGLVIGYSVVVFSGDTAFASGRSCPNKDKGVTCTGTECQKAGACERGECGKDCPGCQKHG